MLDKELYDTIICLWTLAKYSADARAQLKELIAAGKQTREFKRATAALTEAGVDFSKQDADIDLLKLEEVIRVAFECKYSSVAKQVYEDRQAKVSEFAEESVMELYPVTPDPRTELPMLRNVVRASLALNEVDPYSLRRKAAGIMTSVYMSMEWELIPKEERSKIEETFVSLYGISLEEACSSDESNSKVNDSLTMR